MPLIVELLLVPYFVQVSSPHDNVVVSFQPSLLHYLPPQTVIIIRKISMIFPEVSC